MHKLLIVDDDQVTLVALKQTVISSGYGVMTALSAIQALDLVKTNKFSAIISDQNMPMMTGLEFFSQVKELQPNATRILVTGAYSLDIVIDAINKGEIFRFIVKPWLKEELQATLKNAVQRYEMLCHNIELQTDTQAMNLKLELHVRKIEEQNRQLETLNLALEQNLERSVHLCLRTIETFYPLMGRQARKALEISTILACQNNFSAEDRRVLEYSAQLHDIGLVGIPRRLIKTWQHSPASLSTSEEILIKQHPIVGQEFAGFVNPLTIVGDIIRAHHERFDGKGFPDRLAGDQIPWLARLLAVIVYFVENPRGSEIAMANIRHHSGSLFDPEAVRLFLLLPDSNSARKEKEVSLNDLIPGMVLAKDILTINGILLIPEGQSLSKVFISKLREHNRLYPIKQPLFIYC